MTYKGAIFDLDGTLANTLADIADAMNRTLAFYGFPPHPEEDYKIMIGRGLENLVTAALPADQRLPARIDECHARFVGDYSRHSVVSTHLYDGISELLDALQLRRFKMAVFSNKAHDLTCHIVETLLPELQFTEVVGAKSGQPKKPDPAVALSLCAKMGLSPAEVIYFGDSDVDMIMAGNAGLLAVGVTWGFRSPEELRTNGAELLIDHPLEILDRIG